MTTGNRIISSCNIDPARSFSAEYDVTTKLVTVKKYWPGPAVVMSFTFRELAELIDLARP